jgi:hypothetical protein
VLARAIDGTLEPALEDALGVPVDIGGVEANLSGAVRVDRVAIGEVLAIASIEAGVQPGSLLGGHLSPDEIRIDAPRVHLAFGAGGSNVDAPLARLRQRLDLRAHGSTAPTSPHGGLRRVVVTGGDVTIDVAGRGRLSLAGLALRPTARGLRVSAGHAVFQSTDPRWTGGARFTRAAMDVDLPRLEVARFVAVGGAIDLGGTTIDAVTVSGGPGVVALRATGRAGAGDDAGTITATLDRPSRHLSLALSRASLRALAGLAPAGIDLAAARATGSATVTAQSGGVDFDVDASIDGVRVAPGLLADRPVTLDGAIAAAGALRRSGDRLHLAIDRARVARGDLIVTGSGRAEWRPGHHLPERADLRLAVPDTACQAALVAVPEAMRTALGGFDVDGTLAASAALAFDRSDPELTELDLDVDVSRCRVLVEPALADPRTLEKPFDLRLADGHILRVGEGPDFAPLRSLPAHVVAAFVAAEDARFFRHHGFDPEQIERSLAIDLDQGALLRGGSTMTQQLVKNVFLGRERTVARKLQEAVLAWRLEARAPKQLILERYLNILELGERDVYGIGAAARHWFGVPATRLSVRQAAFLAALTPAPRTLSTRIRAHGGLDDAMLARVDLILRAMRQDGFIDRGTFERARAAPLHLAPTSLARIP